MWRGAAVGRCAGGVAGATLEASSDGASLIRMPRMSSWQLSPRIGPTPCPSVTSLSNDTIFTYFCVLVRRAPARGEAHDRCCNVQSHHDPPKKEKVRKSSRFRAHNFTDWAEERRGSLKKTRPGAALSRSCRLRRGRRNTFRACVTLSLDDVGPGAGSRGKWRRAGTGGGRAPLAAPLAMQVHP